MEIQKYNDIMKNKKQEIDLIIKFLNDITKQQNKKINQFKIFRNNIIITNEIIESYKIIINEKFKIDISTFSLLNFSRTINKMLSYINFKLIYNNKQKIYTIEYILD